MLPQCQLKLLLNIEQRPTIAKGAARGSNGARGMLPNTVTGMAHLNESIFCCDGGDGVASCHGVVWVWCARMVGQLKQWRLTHPPTLRGGISRAPMMARREALMVYWRSLLVNTTRTVPVNGLAVRRVMALLNSESMGSCMIGLVDGLIVARGGGAPPLSIFEGGEFGDCLIMVNLGKLCRPYAGGDARGVNHRGALIPGGAVVTVGDPDGLAILEAGSRGEAHGRFVWYAVILQGQRATSAPCCASLEFAHHLYHLAVVDAGRIPFDAIGGLTQHPSDLTLSHTANELLPWGLIIATVLNTCLSGVVQKLIVANPEGGIPGFVICPTVVGVGGHRFVSFG